jgi:hypothetical protein
VEWAAAVRGPVAEVYRAAEWQVEWAAAVRGPVAEVYRAAEWQVEWAGVVRTAAGDAEARATPRTPMVDAGRAAADAGADEARPI